MEMTMTFRNYVREGVMTRRELYGFAVYRTVSPPIRWILIDEKSHVDGPVHHGSFGSMREVRAEINRIWIERLAPIAPLAPRKRRKKQYPPTCDVRHSGIAPRDARLNARPINPDPQPRASIARETPMISMRTNKGRALIFTPERIEQIRNLVERGTRREEIAEIIGVTVGSLQVTCSRLGISLRRRPLANGVAALPRPAAPAATQTESPAPIPFPIPAVKDRPGLALVLDHCGRRREVPLRLADGVLNQIAMEAAIRGITMAEVIAEWLARAAALKD
jgi:hypothetical protein